MNHDTQLHPVEHFQSTTLRSKKKKILTTVLVVVAGLLVAAGVGYGGYLYGSSGDDASVVDSSATGDPREDAAAAGAQRAMSGAFHTVLSVGYPFDSDKTLTTQLGIPGRLQSIAVASSIQDPGYTDVLANKFNEEMGRWRFGDPASSEHSDYVGDVSIIHIGDDWLQETTSDSGRLGGNVIQGYGFTTPADKAGSIAKLAADTKDCAKDSKQGFMISDALAVCYQSNIVRQAQGTYAPTLDLKGYGVIDGQAYVLFGYVLLVDRAYGADEADTKADAFVAGAVPDETKKLIAEYVDALQKSSITSSAR